MDTIDRDSLKDPSTEIRKGRWCLPLVVYDFLIIVLVNILLIVLNPSGTDFIGYDHCAYHLLTSAVSIFLCRKLFGAYRQIWRYVSSSAYITLIISDLAAVFVYYALQRLLPIVDITFLRIFSIVSMSLLLSVVIRLLYQFLCEYANRGGMFSFPVRKLLHFVTGRNFGYAGDDAVTLKIEQSKIRIAIVGAGQIGVMLAEELIKNPKAPYIPCCFIDVDKSKIGREIFGLPVHAGGDSAAQILAKYGVQEIVFALPPMERELMKELYERYRKTGCNLKVYDYPVMQTAESGKRHLREFDIEELLFRKSVDLSGSKINDYYRDKVIMITGGGGSIGSEMCRQIARTSPKIIVILDVYENGAYDIQQELRIAYGGKLDVQVEIVSVCDRNGLRIIFERWHPDVILHAAAHKHVPLMERNCCEAVKNNVFGTLNVVELAIEFKVKRFMMVSTDKAVNPTNVMGATKRMCEMIVQSYSRAGSETKFSSTRFGNVLGSAASVVPLFKKQIMNGGPVTITDKRIIRYFMTIPEASSLVLEAGAMADNGEIFVLDMGKSIRILELAETMIRLSGFEPYRDIDIVEIGLRPGEKLYEELLVQKDKLEKTENSLIFIDRDTPVPMDELKAKLDALGEAINAENDLLVKEALAKAVPTYREPAVVNDTIK